MSLKVLDYGKQHPFGEIFGKTRFLAWPVNAFRVTLPNASGDDDGLNPFERVILKILDVTGTEDARVLADETRIPLDLVKAFCCACETEDSSTNMVTSQAKSLGRAQAKTRARRCLSPRSCSANSSLAKSSRSCIYWTTRIRYEKKKTMKRYFA